MNSDGAAKQELQQVLVKALTGSKTPLSPLKKLLKLRK